MGDTPGALVSFKGRLLAGVGNMLRIYELGKKKLLRKCEHRKLPTHISTLSTLGDRIFAGDGQVRWDITVCQFTQCRHVLLCTIENWETWKVARVLALSCLLALPFHPDIGTLQADSHLHPEAFTPMPLPEATLICPPLFGNLPVDRGYESFPCVHGRLC